MRKSFKASAVALLLAVAVVFGFSAPAEAYSNSIFRNAGSTTLALRTASGATGSVGPGYYTQGWDFVRVDGGTCLSISQPKIGTKRYCYPTGMTTYVRIPPGSSTIWRS